MMAMESLINNLPLDLKLQILLRLPIKSLFILKCVSKTWFHLISDPNFTNLHLQTAVKPITRCLHIHGSRVLSYDLDALVRNGHVTDVLSVPWTNGISIKSVLVIGSCRGFVLLEQDPNLIVWNPSTGEYRQISCIHLASIYNLQWHCLLNYTHFRGFGYDASKDDYMVVWAWNDNRKNKDYIDFFSIRSNSWERFEFVIPRNWIFYDRSRSGILLNGAFHWWSFSHYDLGYYIIAYDMIKRCFFEIAIPKQLSILGTPYLLKLKGCLALYFLNMENKCQIWVMKEYKVESSWTLYGILSWNAFDLLGLSNDDGDVVIGFNGGIIGFDIKTREISRYDIDGYEHSSFECSRKYITYKETLVSLPQQVQCPEK